MQEKIRLSDPPRMYSEEKLEQLEKQYVHYVPDEWKNVYYNVGDVGYFLHTFPVSKGWHLIYVKDRPYLISHWTINFISYPCGLEGWKRHESENKKFLEQCYSNRTLGAKGTYLTAEEYEELSVWIKSTAGIVRVFLGSKRRRDNLYEIAFAYGTEVHYDILADTAGRDYYGIYNFRPVVELSPDMYLIIDNVHNGSTPEKGMLLQLH